MGETSNIARMAEKLSQDLFGVFGWHSTGPKDTNWNCRNPEDHGLKTHPTDAVWYYDEPYSNIRTYILADLKSYKKESITPNSLQKAIVSLSKAVACAEQSDEWKERFLVDRTRPSQVTGLLFVYNHDGEYDKNFGQQLKGVLAGDVRFLSQNRNLIVLGPKEICELNTIVNHIKNLGSTGRSITPLDTSFFFPELKLSKRMMERDDPWSNAAPLTYLVSKIISVKTRKKGSNNAYDDLHVYYRGAGTSIEEFLHLIDFTFRFQQMQTASGNIIIDFVSVKTVSEAASFFNRAKNEYREVSGFRTEQLKKIQFESVQSVIRQYNGIEIGMELRDV